jgi:glycosyltransferase involved in cell wall biosynthesis
MSTKGTVLKLSIIVPAYNEEKLMTGCLEHISKAVEANVSANWTAEVIVVDNNSTDRTAELARAAGAQVVFEAINQISRARNAGARVADGDWFLFIDADSYLHPATLAELLRCIRQGRSAAGGCVVWLDPAPRYAVPFLWIGNALLRLLRLAAGSFVFCRREAFADVGGFSVDLYAAEEIDFSHKLKKWGRQRGLNFSILYEQAHVSSGRKFHLYSRKEIFMHCFRALLLFPWTLRDPEKLAFFYDGRR